MSSRRKATDTSLFRPKEEIEKDASRTSGDMSPETPTDSRPVKRASFDVYADQVERLGVLKYTKNQKISDMVREALDEWLAKQS